ncbi:MAG: electron transport complex subunit E [Victivallaceae bacterium]|nr:electron transport complex subunit E [Victivallaceae bacterium]
MMKTLWNDFFKGIWRENPTLVLLLGMCPTLALTSKAVNGLGMGAATTAVLVGSNLVISLLKNLIPNKVRIPIYIVVIATFVTIVDLCMQAYAPESLYNALGIFIPLIVVNCIVLGRAEAFAAKNTVIRSAFDGLGMGAGFTLSLTVFGCIREFLSTGGIFGVTLVPGWNFMLPALAPGGFILLGALLAGMNYLNERKAVKAGRLYVPPQGMDCRHCRICSIDEK